MSEYSVVLNDELFKNAWWRYVKKPSSIIRFRMLEESVVKVVEYEKEGKVYSKNVHQKLKSWSCGLRKRRPYHSKVVHVPEEIAEVYASPEMHLSEDMQNTILDRIDEVSDTLSECVITREEGKLDSGTHPRVTTPHDIDITYIVFLSAHGTPSVYKVKQQILKGYIVTSLSTKEDMTLSMDFPTKYTYVLDTVMYIPHFIVVDFP